MSESDSINIDDGMIARATSAYDTAIAGGSPARDAMVAALRAAAVQPKTCPFDTLDGPDLEPTDPCPACGMLGTFDAENKCIGGPRR